MATAFAACCAAGYLLPASALAGNAPQCDSQYIPAESREAGKATENRGSASPLQIASAPTPGLAQLIEKAEEQGSVRVIVGLRLPDGFTPEGDLAGPDAVKDQRNAIVAAKQALLESLQGTGASAYASWDSVPHVALEVDAAALRQLADSPHVTTIQEDSPVGTTAPE